MDQILFNERWEHKLKYNRGSMTVRLIKANNSYSLLLFDPKFAKKFANSSNMIFDATYQVTPTIFGVKQLFVIMLKKYNRVSINEKKKKNCSLLRTIFEN